MSQNTQAVQACANFDNIQFVALVLKKIKISLVLCLSRAIISLRVICHDEFFLSYHILSLAKFGIFCH